LQFPVHHINPHSFPTRRSSDLKCIRFDMPAQAGVLFSFRDLSHQLQLERDHDRLASIPEESPFPIVELDREGNLLYANPVLMNRSEEHTSELQSLAYLVCRLLL